MARLEVHLVIEGIDMSAANEMLFQLQRIQLNGGPNWDRGLDTRVSYFKIESEHDG